MTMTSGSDAPPALRPRTGSWLSTGGMLAGLAAFVSASCCVLPLAFATLGLGGTWLSLFDAAFQHRTELMVAALAMIGLGWGAVLWRRRRRAGSCDGACVRTAPLTIVALVAAKFLVVGAWAVTEYQGAITQWLFEIR